MYRYLSAIISRKHRWNVVGCIFDSLPARRDASVAARALMASINTNFLMRYLAGFLIYTFFYTSGFLSKLFSWRTRNDTTFWDYMYNEPANWPCLYLYSKSDAIVDFRYVEEVMENRKKIGADVSSKCWSDSEHVAHLRKHPAEYKELCVNFLDRCLNPDKR